MSITTTRTAQATIDRNAKRAKATRATAVIAALAISGILVSQASYSAFTAQTNSKGNAWSTGEVDLTNSTSGAAAFNVKDMMPGQTGEKVITVTAKSSSDAKVRMYTREGKATNDLDKYMKVTITTGQVDASGKFTADANATPVATTLHDLVTDNVDFASGVGEWNVAKTSTAAPTTSKSYEIDWTFDENAPQSLQDSNASADMYWALGH